MSGNHESSWEIIVVGPQLLIFEDKNRKLLEMDSFLPSHTYLGSCQTIKFEEKILGTLGDALSNLIFYLLLPQIENEITSCMIHLCFVFPSKLYHLYIRQEACMVWQLSSQACLVDQQICRLVFCGLAKRSWCIASKNKWCTEDTRNQAINFGCQLQYFNPECDKLCSYILTNTI